jgi:hypothetical protein
VRVSRTSSLTATSVAVATPPADGFCIARPRYTFAGLGGSPLCESYEMDHWAGATAAFHNSGAG